MLSKAAQSRKTEIQLCDSQEGYLCTTSDKIQSGIYQINYFPQRTMVSTTSMRNLDSKMSRGE